MKDGEKRGLQAAWLLFNKRKDSQTHTKKQSVSALGCRLDQDGEEEKGSLLKHEGR